MNRIDRTFDILAKKGEKGLVGFITAGDPDIPTSLRIASAMCAAGLDCLELGIPFSDPTADGPVIQRASMRALAGGMSVDQALRMVRRLREGTDVPIVLFSYYNPILSFGGAAFNREAISAGADGLLVLDLPPEESEELTGGWPEERLSLIRLVGPTTPPERMEKIAATASGFLYLVTKTGVTGSGGLDPIAVSSRVRLLKSVSRLPVCAGFGVSTPAEAASVAESADGVVIGSAFERIIEENLNRADLADTLGGKVREVKRALC